MANKTSSEDFVSLLNQRLKLSKKFSEKYKKDVKKWIKDYEINTMSELDFDGLDNKLQIPYIFATIESNLPSIFETMPNIIMTQRGKEDKDFTDFASQVWDYLVEKIKLEEIIEEVGQDFLVTGQGTLKYGWELQTTKVQQDNQVPITNTDGSPTVDPTTGQPMTQTVTENIDVPIVDRPVIKAYSYKDVEYSPESKFTLDDDSNQIPYVIFHHSFTKDQIEEMYGKVLKNTEGGVLNLKEISSDFDDLTEKELNADDLKRIDLYEYYGNLPKEYSNDKDWKSSKVYCVIFTKSEIVKQPEAITKKPVLQIGNYGYRTNFFRFGEPKVLRELEQDVSLGRSRMADLRDKQGTKIWIPQGIEVDERSIKKAADYTIMRGMSQNPPQYVTPPPIPETILDGIAMSRTDIQMASAQLDISRGGDTSTVNTATGQKIFQQATDKRNARKKKKIGNLIKAVAKNLLVLCGYNWDVETFASITDLDPQLIVQSGYIEKLKNLGEDYDVDIELESITSNKETMSAQAIALYRETKDDPIVNRAEVLKEVLQIGFNKKDFDRFLAQQVTPEQALQTLQFLVQARLLNPQLANELALGLGQLFNQGGQGQPGNNVGRPPTADPTQIVQKSMPGADSTQITAQNDAAYKQQGVPKGAQNT